ncbi:hypothetical protein [Ammoniphilus sp. CFH 90114]|uniref:hypothetical protein n=1 Tax=Ammoniphilus sp. CFH 90114 TaxID=2493665 RepID=UPI00100FF96E|nr:hypothetical protein [Ammoniphilus sp. CFH 90114]RXT08853.1 hypothetical protein EIZ39_08615 [Ammoniphilus sp. CFH 90114]
MRNLANQLIDRIAKQQWNLELNTDNFDWESVILYKNEIDPDLIPINDIDKLRGDPLIVWFMDVQINEDTEYLMGLIQKEDKQGFQYLVSLINGERVWSDFVD